VDGDKCGYNNCIAADGNCVDGDKCGYNNRIAADGNCVYGVSVDMIISLIMYFVFNKVCLFSSGSSCAVLVIYPSKLSDCNDNNS
jgi:hypothetical protein